MLYQRDCYIKEIENMPSSAASLKTLETRQDSLLRLNGSDLLDLSVCVCQVWALSLILNYVVCIGSSKNVGLISVGLRVS